MGVRQHTAAEAPTSVSSVYMRRQLLAGVLTIVAAIRGIVERIARLSVVPPRGGGRLAHLLLAVALELIHDSGRAEVTRQVRLL